MHELVHVAAPASDHGLAHTVMLKRAMEYLRSLVAAPATARRERESNMDRTMDREEHATLRRDPTSLLAAMESLEAWRARRGSLDAAWERHLRAGREIIDEHHELAGRPAVATLKDRLERCR